MRRLRLLLILAIAGLLLAACRVDTEVRIDVGDAGSGTVTVTVVLDREAAQRLGDPATAVRLDDLRATGWTVPDPATDAASGKLTYRATREFASPEDLPAVLAEVGGGDGSASSTGIFLDVDLGVGDGFARTTYSFSSAVELSGSLEQFSDLDLTAALGGLPLARTPEELAAEGGNETGSAQLDVLVRLPGGTPDSNGKVQHDVARWNFPLTGGSATSTTINSSSTKSERAPVLLVGFGLLALVLALVSGCIAFVRRRG